jgi:hypothetical protein
MPKSDPVADALAATDKRIGQSLKLPPLLDRLPDDVRQKLNVAIVSGEYSLAHLARATNTILANHDIEATVTYNTVAAYQEYLRGHH